MHDHAPTVYLLAGSAAPSYAEVLVAQGVDRLDPDDGCDGGRDQLGARLVEYIDAGRDVVLGDGLGEPADRDFYKRLVEEHGGEWCVIHISTEHAAAVQRLQDAQPLS